MAIFRKIHTSFWEDEKVVDEMTPEDRYFMLYLMTNPHTNQIGCYNVTIRQIEFETGYNKETVLKLIKRFTNDLKIIKYSEDTKEVLILNWYKYNWTNSPKVKACILKEFKSIKNKAFRYSINTVLIQYGYSMDMLSQEEKEEEEEQEQEQKKENKNLIPTKQEILDYVHSLCKKIDVDNFIAYYEASNWCDKSGLPINWKQKAITWANKYKEPEEEDIIDRNTRIIKELEAKAIAEGKRIC